MEFWNAYPRKEDRDVAWRAWQRAILKYDPQKIIAAARQYADRYRADPRPYQDKFRFYKYPGTWLNAGSYKNHEESAPEAESDDLAEHLRRKGIKNWRDLA